jgi:hypothetical protein
MKRRRRKGTRISNDKQTFVYQGAAVQLIPSFMYNGICHMTEDNLPYVEPTLGPETPSETAFRAMVKLNQSV